MEQRLRELRLQLLSKETSNLTHHEALERAEVEFPPPLFFFVQDARLPVPLGVLLSLQLHPFSRRCACWYKILAY